MSSSPHYNASNFTIPAFSSDKEDEWSFNTIISLVGVLITALPVTLLLWKKFRGLRSSQQASPSPQPESTSEMEMGNCSTVLPEPSATSVSSRADVELHPGNHQNQADDTARPIQMDNIDEVVAERRAMAPSGTYRDVSRPSMIEVQQRQPPKLLDRASFPVEALRGPPDEEHEQAYLDSDDFVVIVRRATTA